jgi:hypothetical protein
MVGPMSDDERRAGSQRLYAAFVVLVGASAGLMALSGGATPLEVLIVVLAGLVIGLLLVWYLLRMAA